MEDVSGATSIEEIRPSQTALMVAAMRAQHFHRALEPKLLRDAMAMGLAGFETMQAVDAFLDAVAERLAAHGDHAVAGLILRRIAQGVCARGRLLEEELAGARQAGIDQLVMLGAGLDSTAYRCGAYTAGMDVFEVDQPQTLAWKRKRLAALGVPPASNVRQINHDLERRTLIDVLLEGGVQRDRSTLFSWMGVQLYLTEDAVMATLRTIASFAPGSRLVMDLLTPPAEGQGAEITEGVRQLQRAVADMGEPIRSAFTVADFTARLGSIGFDAIHIPLCAEENARMLAWSPHAEPWPEDGQLRFVTAQVRG